LGHAAFLYDGGLVALTLTLSTPGGQVEESTTSTGVKPACESFSTSTAGFHLTLAKCHIGQAQLLLIGPDFLKHRSNYLQANHPTGRTNFGGSQETIQASAST
jgi:hypothetical protein